MRHHDQESTRCLMDEDDEGGDGVIQIGINIYETFSTFNKISG